MAFGRAVSSFLLRLGIRGVRGSQRGDDRSLLRAMKSFRVCIYSCLEKYSRNDIYASIAYVPVTTTVEQALRSDADRPS